MSSFSQISEELNKVIKPKLEEILEFQKQIISKEDERLEAVAAKIINELKSVIQECSKDILVALEQKELVITPLEKEDKSKPIGLSRYSYPNHGVGNAELGSSGNPKALTWPFGEKQSSK